MTAVTLHPTPRIRDVVFEQVRIVGLSLRREAFIAAVVLLAVGTFLVAGDLTRGGPGFDTSEPFPTGDLSFLFPFAIWRGERRFGPAFVWTLPADRQRMALAKVFAGWVWMIAALAAFASWLFTLALFSHVSPMQTVMRVPFVATTAMYLLGSALVLGLRHPLRWLLTMGGFVFLLMIVTEAFGRRWPSVRTTADLAPSSILAFLWLGAGVAALLAAVSRHGERRRH